MTLLIWGWSRSVEEYYDAEIFVNHTVPISFILKENLFSNSESLLELCPPSVLAQQVSSPKSRISRSSSIWCRAVDFTVLLIGGQGKYCCLSTSHVMFWSNVHWELAATFADGARPSSRAHAARGYAGLERSGISKPHQQLQKPAFLFACLGSS